MTQSASCSDTYLLLQRLFHKAAAEASSQRPCNHTNQIANPVLSSLINGFGLNFVSLHFQANYGDLSETDRFLRIERYNAFNVAGKSQIQQEQLQRATGYHI